MAINFVDLVGDSRPVVTPQATQSMIEGIRGGFITANEIIERSSERSKAKERAEIALANQQTAEATDQGLIEARRNQQLLAGEQAKQTRDLLPLARRATEEKLFGDINSGQIQRYGLKEKLAALNELGFAPSPDPQKGITPEFAAEVNKNFSQMLKWQKDKADAKFELANIKEGELDTGSGIFKGPVDILTAAPVEQGKVETLRTRAAKTLPEFLRDAPPGGIVAPVTESVIQPVAAAPAPLIQPAQIAAQRAQLFNTGVPGAAAMTDQQIAQTIPQPAPVAVVQPSIVQPAGVPPGFTQVKPAPTVTAAADTLTNKLERELVDISNTDAAINQARQLAVPGIVGPGQIGVTRGMHQLLAAIGRPESAQTYTNQDQLNTVIANEIADYVQKWKGAISDRELRFFQAARPRIDSTPERWSSYLDEWQAKNEKLRQVVSGQLPPDDAATWAANSKNSGASVAPAISTPSVAAENTTAIGGRTYKVKIDSAGRKRYFIVQ